jgi:ABC-type amino acid transport substrate-binding protein
MRKIFFHLSLLGLLFSTNPAVSQSSEETSRYGDIIFATPYIKSLRLMKTKGLLDGPFFQELEKIERAIDLKIAPVVLPFARVIQMNQNNKAQLGIYLENNERNMRAVPVKVIQPVDIVMVSLRHSQIFKKSDVKNKTIGISAKGTTRNSLHALPYGYLLKFTSHKDLMKALLSGKVQAIITPDFRFLQMMDQHQLSSQDFNPPIKVSSSRLMLYASQEFAKDRKRLLSIENSGFLKGFKSSNTLLKEAF